MDKDELAVLLDGEVNEWRETSRVAESVADALEQARDALDAELSTEALEDALSNYRCIDYSGPAKESDRLAMLDKIESALDDELMDAREREAEEATERLTGRVIINDGGPYDQHAANVQGVADDGTVTVTLDDDTHPMEFPASALIPHPGDEEYARMLKPWAVGINIPEGNGRVLRRFSSLSKATKFASKLDGVDEGAYYVSGPDD